MSFTGGCASWFSKKSLELRKNKHAQDLLNRLLDINPKTRITAKEALMHPYFSKMATITNQCQIVGAPTGHFNWGKIGERSQIIRWMIEINVPDVAHSVLFLAIRLLDLYMFDHYVISSKHRLIAACVMILSLNLHNNPEQSNIKDWKDLCNGKYEEKEIQATCLIIAESLKFDLF